MENEKLQNKKKFDYKWIIVAVCALMIFVGLGFCSSIKGLFLEPITKYTGIERSLFSFNGSIRYITTSIVNIFFGLLIAKLGVKVLVGSGFLSLCISMVLYGVGQSVWVFYLAGMFLGLGLAWTTTTIIGYVVNKWCKKNRGTILGAILATNGLGGALATQIVSPIIVSAPDGYKKAYFLIAIIVAIIGVLAVIFLKDKKKDDEEQAESSPKKKSRGESWVGIDSKTALRKPYFYGAAVCIFFTGMVLQGITSIAPAHMKDVGLDNTFYSAIISAGMIILTCTKFLTGFMYDKLGLRITITINYVASVIAMAALAFLNSGDLGRALCVIYIITANVALPLETIMLPIYASDLFGEKSYGKMLGIFVSINTAGYALGEFVLNLCYDLMGTYQSALLFCAGLMLVVIVVLQFVINASNKQKRLIQSEFSDAVKI